MLIALVVLVAGCGMDRVERAPTPDIVMIVVDTLRADHLGSYGYDRATSPNIDALAADSIRYTAAFSHAPWTTPSVASLLTSQYPKTLGIAKVQSRLADDVTLLPEVLGRAGYATAAFVSHTFVSRKWGFAQGFDVFDESNVKDHLATTSPGISDAAIAWLEARQPDRPVFLLLHYFDPHFCYVEQPGFPFGGRPPEYTGPVVSGMFPGLIKNPERFGQDDADEMRRLYDSEIALTDLAIGRVLDFLKSKGSYETTAIILTADHGEEFLDHGALDHGKTLYNELLHVPLLLKLPGARPATVAEPTGLIDVFPTLLDWLDLTPPPAVRGRSLLGPGDGRPRPIFLETRRAGWLQGVIYGDHKLIVDRDSGETRLYQLSADPGELEDLSHERPERVAVLGRLLDAWAAERDGRAAADLDLDEHETARLEALGYL